MNRQERRAARSTLASNPQGLTAEQMNAMVGQLTETISRNFPGCQVTLLISKPTDHGDRWDHRYGSTAPWEWVKAAFASMVVARDGSL